MKQLSVAGLLCARDLSPSPPPFFLMISVANILGMIFQKDFYLASNLFLVKIFPRESKSFWKKN